MPPSCFARPALMLAALALAACSGGEHRPAAAPAPLSEKIDAVFAGVDSAGPGCAAGVIADGAYLHAKGYGLANLDYGAPISPDSVFRTGSLSKQFTAAAIAILAARGQIDLDTDVHQYLPDLTDYSAKVTIRQMIHHLSGMGDYETEANHFYVRPGVPFRFGNEDYWTIEEFYAEVAKQPLLLAPGERFEYSNLAYFLLSQVVERVSGETLRQFADDNLFSPLGMSASFFNDNVNGVVKNRASGYQAAEGGGYETYDTNLDFVGDGGVYTSLNDFIKWDRALSANTLPEGVAAVMTAPYAPAIADPWEPLSPGVTYGYGLAIGEYKDEPVITHTGHWVGFSSLYARLTDRDRAVVVFCNAAEIEAPERGWKIVDAVIAAAN